MCRAGHPIFNLDLKDLHARIEALPWVEDAIVLRRLPNVVHIDLTEREPFAFYLEADKLALIDKKGVTITRRHLSGFSHLPVFSGANAARRRLHGGAARLSGRDEPHGGSPLDRQSALDPETRSWRACASA